MHVSRQNYEIKLLNTCVLLCFSVGTERVFSYDNDRTVVSPSIFKVLYLRMVHSVFENQDCSRRFEIAIARASKPKTKSGFCPVNIGKNSEKISNRDQF